MLRGFSIKYRFLIGAAEALATEIEMLVTEQAIHHDLLLLWNVSNKYSSLSLRSLHSIIHLNQLYDFTFFIKTDDDMFLNTPRILSELQAMPRARLYWGRSSCFNPLLTEGRWRETKWHACNTYFPYHYGGMYVLTADLVRLIAENSPHLQTYMSEDVSMGSWLAPYNLHRVDDVRIFTGHERGRCSQGFLAVHIHHQLAHKQMHKFQDNLNRKGVLCTDIHEEQPISWESLPKNCYKDPVAVT